jgi:hypothetical protein
VVDRGLWRLWFIHLAFVGLYIVVAWSRFDTVREGHVYFTSVAVDLTVTLPSVAVALVLPRVLGGRVRYRGERLLVWTFAEFPVLVGLVGLLSGGTLPSFAWHIGVTLVLMAWTAPRPQLQAVDPVQ